MTGAIRTLADGVRGEGFLEALDLPGEITHQEQAGAPGVLSVEERAMLVRLVARTWRGDGAIVGIDHHLGDDLVPILERTVAPTRESAAPRRGDFTRERWSGAPIELALVDGCTTPSLNAQVARELLPAMIPGGSTLIHQDFFVDRLPWIKVTMGFLADYFRWVGQVRSSSVYRSVGAVPADVAAYDPFLEGTFDDCLRYHDTTDFGDLGRADQFSLALSRGLLVAHKGRQPLALEYLDSLRQEYADVLAGEEAGGDARRRLDRATSQVAGGVLYRTYGWDGVEETIDGHPTALPLLGDAAVGTSRLRAVDLTAGLGRIRARPRVAGMTSGAEQALLEELAARTWRGDGAIVDVGSFLGASLVAEAEGVQANAGAATRDPGRWPGRRPIHGFERGFLPAPASPGAKRERVYGDVTIQLGDSFVPRLRRAVAPYDDLVELHVGDLHEQTWDGSPIELAFVDAGTTAAANARTVTMFYPALIGGASTLVVRDLCSEERPWLNVTMGYLADYLRWEGQVRASMVFSSVARVPADVAAYDPFTEDSLDDCLRFHDAVGHVAIGREWQFRLALSRVRLVAAKGDRDGATDLLREVEDEYADLVAEPGHHADRLGRLGAAIRIR